MKSKTQPISFDVLEKQYGKKFGISKFYLLQLTKQNKNFSINFLSLILNLILCLLSLISIFKVKIFKKKIAHYYILPKNSQDDFRSDEIFKYIKKSKTLNIVRSSSFLNSLKYFILKPNVFFFNSFFNVIIFFNYKYSSNLNKNYISLHKCYIKYFIFLKKILFYLDVKKIISIDDYRTSSFFQKISLDLEILCIGYMHGRFTKYQCLKYYLFSKYFVWGKYFASQLKKFNPIYKKKKNIFQLIKHPFLNKKFKRKNNSKFINILYVLEENINYDTVNKYLNQILKEKKFKLYFKARPNQKINEKILYLAKKFNILIYQDTNLGKIFERENFVIILSHDSTALLEASYYEVYPIKIPGKIKKYEQYKDEKHIFKINTLTNLNTKIKNIITNKKKLLLIKKNLWFDQNLCEGKEYSRNLSKHLN